MTDCSALVNGQHVTHCKCGAVAVAATGDDVRCSATGKLIAHRITLRTTSRLLPLNKSRPVHDDPFDPDPELDRQFREFLDGTDA